MHLKACRLAGLSKPVAHLLVLNSQRQPPHAALRRGAEFRGFVNRIPEPGGIDLQVGCGCRHEAVPVMMVRASVRFTPLDFNAAPVEWICIRYPPSRKLAKANVKA